MSIAKVMLATAAPKDLGQLKYPLVASPKLDGIRCILHPELGAVSRTMKPIPNLHIREQLHELRHLQLDGELVTFSGEAMDDFNTIQSEVMSHDGQPDFKLLVFDSFEDTEEPFTNRLLRASAHCLTHSPSQLLNLVPHWMIDSAAALEAHEEHMVSAGYEGVMVRDPTGRYKQGRSTLKEQLLLKVKRFADAEGTIVALEEEHDIHGHPKGTLGAMVLATEEWGTVVVGSGFTAYERVNYWCNGAGLHGKVVTFKYQPSGMKDKPRFPTFKGFRLGGA